MDACAEWGRAERARLNLADQAGGLGDKVFLVVGDNGGADAGIGSESLMRRRGEGGETIFLRLGVNERFELLDEVVWRAS